jgi:hypothetical protein
MLYIFGRGEERRGEVFTGFWWANWRESDQLEDLGENWKTTLKFNFQKQDGGVRGVNCSGAV